jgi:hypothetical protein
MNADPQSHDAAEIIRGLSCLPGGIDVRLTAKRFPRRGPAEPGTGYMQQEQSFDPHHLPEQLAIPFGMDEIVITMRGELDQAQSTVALLQQLNDLLGAVGSEEPWDYRTFFQHAIGSAPAYQVTVFTDTFSVVPSA